MGNRVQGPLAIVLSVSLSILACSLPQRLLDSSDLPQDSTEQPAPADGGAGDESGAAGEGSDGWGGLTTSPAYDIYVGANVSGNCGAYTNSGGFAALTFDSAFHGIRFSPPSTDGVMGPFGGIYHEGGEAIPIVGLGLLGEGELGAFTFCPMYEPEEHACAVTSGPSPFEPSLKLLPGDIPVVPSVGTPVPSGGGEVLLIYSIGAASDLSPIMTWDCEIGAGALGSSIDPAQVAFSTSWDRLMLGEEFSLEAISGDEGETWEWTIRFVPVE